MVLGIHKQCNGGSDREQGLRRGILESCMANDGSAILPAERPRLERLYFTPAIAPFHADSGSYAFRI